MTDEPLITQTDQLAERLLDIADDDTVPFAEKLSLLGRLTAYLQVKHRLEGDGDKKGGSFDEWRKQHEAGAGSGSDRPRRGRAKRKPKHPANADAPGLADGLPEHTAGESDDRRVPRFGDDPGDTPATAFGAHWGHGSVGDGDE